MLVVEDLVVRYGRLQALHGVSLTVAESDFVAVLGRNGAGKTTLVHAVAGLIRPASGLISYRGRRIDRAGPPAIVRSGISVVPEGRQLFSALSARDNLRLGSFGRATASVSGLLAALAPRRREIEERLERVVALLPELAGLLARPAGALSGGEQQMVAVGRALMAEPRMLLVDELSLGLAPLVVERLLEHLRGLHGSGIGILLIEQNISLALAASNYAYVLEGGYLRASGPSEQIARDAAVLEAYLGTREVSPR